MEKTKETHLIPTGEHYLNCAMWFTPCGQYPYTKEEWELKSSLAFHEHP